jgi:hypothetical protein
MNNRGNKFELAPVPAKFGLRVAAFAVFLMAASPVRAEQLSTSQEWSTNTAL